jgi:hypothetical protein
MGGTDEPSNLVELTVTEHAEAHRLLYEKYGKPEDKLAWQCLAGIITKEEIVLALCSLAGKKGGAIGGKKGKGRKQTKEWIEKRARSGEQNGMYGRKHTDEAKKMRSDFMKEKIKNEGNNFIGTKNFLESVKKRTELGLMPSQISWTCEKCGKSGKGISNFNRWHKNRC